MTHSTSTAKPLSRSRGGKLRLTRDHDQGPQQAGLHEWRRSVTLVKEIIRDTISTAGRSSKNRGRSIVVETLVGLRESPEAPLQAPSFIYSHCDTHTLQSHTTHRALHKITTNYKNNTTATTTQCKLQNKCSFVCVNISKCLVGRGKTPPVQVAVGSSRMDASHVCTLDNALVGTRKTPPAQVADNAHCKCQ